MLPCLFRHATQGGKAPRLRHYAITALGLTSMVLGVSWLFRSGSQGDRAPAPDQRLERALMLAEPRPVDVRPAALSDEAVANASPDDSPPSPAPRRCRMAAAGA
jgi:hypothetical protein